MFGGNVQQGLQGGDFNVLPVNTIHTAQMGARRRGSILFDVIYYPTEEGARAECLAVSDVLSRILGTVTTPNGDRIHCSSIECTIQEDTMHCTVGYPYFTYKPVSQDRMTAVKILQEG